MTKYRSFAGRIKVLSSAPSTASQGDVYFDSTDLVLKYYNGTTWISSGAFTTTTSTSTSTSTTTTSTSTS